MAFRAALIGLIGIFALMLPASSAVRAQEEDVQKIAAIVNDELISEYDVDQRLLLVFASSGRRPGAEILEQMRPEILGTLIDEKLQLQAAREFELTMSEEELLNAVEYIASQNDMDASAFRSRLGAAGVAWRGYLEQVRANLVWDRLVRGRFSGSVTVSEEDVEAYLARIKENADKPERRVAEIFLAVDNPEEDQAVARQAAAIYSQLEQGASFPEMARQFSQAATAATGGDIGWVREGLLDPEIDATLKQLQPREVSRPVRTVAGYHIVLVINERTLGKADPDKDRYTIKQVAIPFGEDGGIKAEADLTDLRTEINSCSSVDRLAAQVENARVLDFGTLIAADLAGDMREKLTPLTTGGKTVIEPTETDVRFLYVCEKVADKPALPTKADIDNRLSGQQIARMARRYLRDLRRDATIEYR
ncbi:MAG: peptidylprolyl isomerase [Alphaproteobacteria bacterium]